MRWAHRISEFDIYCLLELSSIGYVRASLGRPPPHSPPPHPSPLTPRLYTLKTTTRQGMRVPLQVVLLLVLLLLLLPLAVSCLPLFAQLPTGRGVSENRSKESGISRSYERLGKARLRARQARFTPWPSYRCTHTATRWPSYAYISGTSRTARPRRRERNTTTHSGAKHAPGFSA